MQFDQPEQNSSTSQNKIQKSIIQSSRGFFLHMAVRNVRQVNISICHPRYTGYQGENYNWNMNGELAKIFF